MRHFTTAFRTACTLATVAVAGVTVATLAGQAAEQRPAVVQADTGWGSPAHRTAALMDTGWGYRAV
ncbi:hypothetical protein [Streptomyces sp. Isolate_45]|uniref:hypothetical protein n=1 Tax=Streptomyces sp. Isolate_45 TaxID=2950111 RepID=UPI002481D8A8|nr:hypothetical protein [Streptomyces sp. Isolate_45]MDA5282956.1 hypothetical protein [Streptomyces sp. Isolate_45]